MILGLPLKNPLTCLLTGWILCDFIHSLDASDSVLGLRLMRGLVCKKGWVLAFRELTV